MGICEPALTNENRWDMNAKPMHTIYQGLSGRPTLKALTVRCPSQRVTRPVCLVPPIPSLEKLHLVDIDPLCYPDDFSLLLLGSKKLEELNLHFSPRMRREGEPSINLHALFGRCIKAGWKLRIKRLGLQNCYVMNRGEFHDAFSHSDIERISFINNVDVANPTTVFFDSSWASQPRSRDEFPKNLKMMRGEGMDRNHARMVAELSGLEEFYLIGRRPPASTRSQITANGSSNGTSPQENNSGSTPLTPTTQTPQEAVSVASLYLAALMQQHGQTLKYVLLSEQWQLGLTALANFARACPNLEQFGFTVEDHDVTIVRNMMRHAPKIWALRYLSTPSVELIDEDFRTLALSLDFTDAAFKNIRWVGVGYVVYKVMPGNITVENDSEKIMRIRSVPKIRRDIREVDWKDAEHVEIFGLDKMEL
jgi:hypothetical protein